jgi:hypothetical protein
LSETLLWLPLDGGDPQSEDYSRNKLLAQGVWAF